ncbi:MAG: methyltransferase domain-containing protein [Sporichthyaceae bacterium]
MGTKTTASYLTARSLLVGQGRRLRGRARRELRRRGWTPPGQSAQAARPAVVGVVEDFTRNTVEGWIAVPAGTPPIKVTLHLGAVEVAATWATAGTDRTGTGEVRGFRFLLNHIWNFAKTTDTLTVRAGGMLLPIAGRGMFLRPESDGTRAASTLKRKLAEGHVFSRGGRLQLSKKLDHSWQKDVLDLYAGVRTLIKEQFGYETFVIYGSLLGAVREGGFIGHDVDFDVAILVSAESGAHAGAQMKKIAFALIEAGYDLEGRRTALHVHHPQKPAIRIDLFHLFFDNAGVLGFPFGVAGTTDVRKQDWRGVTEVPFATGTVACPVNGEQFAEAIYGAGWREPTPGFDWSRDRTKRALGAFIAHDDIEEIYWANFYARTEYTSGSTFFTYVNDQPGAPTHVIDIGCGDGRDSYAFGMAGKNVTGLDRSHIGVRHATKKAVDMGMGERVGFVACDVGEAAELRAVLTAAVERAGTAPVLFYARFFLHSIPEDVQATLMSVLSSVARGGDAFAAEFRTTGDADRMKVHTKHYRRFQDGPKFGIALREKYGFDVDFEVESTGLSPYKDEDPVLYRVLGRRRPHEA